MFPKCRHRSPTLTLHSGSSSSFDKTSLIQSGRTSSQILALATPDHEKLSHTRMVGNKFILITFFIMLSI